MDLIYTDASFNDVGVLLDSELDLTFGKDENNFELITATELSGGGLVYIENTDYGGIIDGIKIKTEKELIRYNGRTFQGIMASYIIPIPTAADYATATGDVKTIVRNLINASPMTSLFTVASETAGYTVTNYKFDRYKDYYSQITKMLLSVGCRMTFKYNGAKVVIDVEKAGDYESDKDFSSDELEIEIEKAYKKVNHLICLGRGELRDREVVHLYANAAGDISQTKTQTGINEYTAVFDYPNAESLDELIKSGTARFYELLDVDTAEVDYLGDYEYFIGDKITATEEKTSTKVTNYIVKKTVVIKNNEIIKKYELGVSL